MSNELGSRKGLHPIEKAETFQLALDAYYEVLENGGFRLSVVQSALAKTLREIGNGDMAIQFTILAGQSANTEKFEEQIKEIAQIAQNFEESVERSAKAINKAAELMDQTTHR